MNGKFVLGIVLAMVAIFIWGAAFWMNPLPNRLFKSTGADEELQEILKDRLPESGLYMLPSSHLEKAEMERLYASGPIAMIFYYSGGMTGVGLNSMLKSLLLNLISVALLALLMFKARNSLDSYRCRVAFACLAGLGMAVFSNLTNAIWFFYPWAYAFTGVLYDVTTWIVAGLVLAKFIKPETE